MQNVRPWPIVGSCHDLCMTREDCLERLFRVLAVGHNVCLAVEFVTDDISESELWLMPEDMISAWVSPGLTFVVVVQSAVLDFVVLFPCQWLFPIE